ncbi:ROK family protein [Qipengyuania sp. 6D47A]|uniref:fructokinase n=1 Tax=Qipengyuania qiaonensis TaxID=2867240 RepID=A0ABS7JEB8_9SPHN|nr:ROK family protein [Qipengyuania qiaonensis]MBX7484018.1 ROK family protein [Qipengyuania qiaonensis]
MVAGIEAGGTKFVVGVAKATVLPTARTVIPTTRPAETLAAVTDWLREQGPIRAVGIASFGPVELDPASPRWGHITETPKPGWNDCDLAGIVGEALGVPVGFDTDVNGAALAEFVYGAGKGMRSLVYVTVGTGIGGGLVVDGRILSGAGHPEMGHFYPRRSAKDWNFIGACPYHGDCLEGLISGPAIQRRWGARLSDLPDDHQAHGIVADYLAQLCHTIFALTATETIVLGGGVMATTGLLDRVRSRANAIGGCYFPGRARQTIVAPQLGSAAGLVGAIELGRRAVK